MRRRISVELFFLSLSLASVNNAQWISDPVSESRIRRGINYVYNLSFDSARTEFQAVVSSQPQHPAGHFFIAMIEWWKIMIDLENRSRDDKFISMLDNVIDICDRRLKKDENDIIGLFFKGGALGFQGRLYGNREDWLKAANCGRSAIPIVRKAYDLEPDNYDILLGIGIYNYYAAIIPDLYPWVKPLMLLLPKGDKMNGLGQLRTASEKAHYANVEATYFLVQVLQNFENQYLEASLNAEKLHAMFPDNVIFHKYVGRSYAALSQWKETQRIFTEIIKRKKLNRVGYGTWVERESEYYLGLAAMELTDYHSALQNFYRADELSRILDSDGPSGYMSMTNLKIGMIYDIQNKRTLAISQYNKVIDMDNFRNAHELAKEYMKTPYRNP